MRSELVVMVMGTLALANGAGFDGQRKVEIDRRMLRGRLRSCHCVEVPVEDGKAMFEGVIKRGRWLTRREWQASSSVVLLL